jgi:hypothetical protein
MKQAISKLANQAWFHKPLVALVISVGNSKLYRYKPIRVINGAIDEMRVWLQWLSK